MKLLDRVLNWLDRLAGRLAGRSPEELRLYAVISKEVIEMMAQARTKPGKPVDPGAGRGKEDAQAGHAFLHAWWNAMERFPRDARRYRWSQAAAKVVLVVDTIDEVKALYDAFEPHCGATLVRDAGRTVFKEPTVTFVGIGPITKAAFEEFAPGLKMLK